MSPSSLQLSPPLLPPGPPLSILFRIVLLQVHEVHASMKKIQQTVPLFMLYFTAQAFNTCKKGEQWVLMKFKNSPMPKLVEDARMEKKDKSNQEEEREAFKRENSKRVSLGVMRVFILGLDLVVEGDCGLSTCTWVRPIASHPSVPSWQGVKGGYADLQCLCVVACLGPLTLIKCGMPPNLTCLGADTSSLLL